MTMCRHGYEILCPKCPREAAAARSKAIREGKEAYFILPWRGDGNYRIEDAVPGKRYKLASPADKYARRLNAFPGNNYVVRCLSIPEAPEPAPEPKPEPRLRGTVKWWNDCKGYGFLTAEGRPDIFAHYTAIMIEGFKTLQEGATVTFGLIEGPKGPQAVDIRPENSV